MCKIITLTNTSKIKKIEKVINTMSQALSGYERDGFGYAIQGESGIFGERTLSPSSFKSQFETEILDLPFLDLEYNRFGVKSKAQGAALFHGRTSTNHKTLINTHPILKHDWTLIHNGVVSNNGPNYNMLTTNDTEHLVHYMGTESIKSIERHLTGYYAFTAIDPQGQLHVVRDSIATLYMSYIKSIDSFIFATVQDLIIDVCKELKWTHSVISPVKNNQHLIFEGNKIVSHSEINPRGRTSYESQFASKSLGRELTDVSFKGPVTQAQGIDNEYEALDESQASYFAEIDSCLDRSYSFRDYHDQKITLEDFQALTDDEKLYCTVIRGDGTICCPWSYHTEQLYQGAI